jgi:WD40 repeat protein
MSLPISLLQVAKASLGHLLKKNCKVQRSGPSMSFFAYPICHRTTTTLLTERENRVEKLYGHGYELRSAATSSTGRLVASSCRAATPEHAVVRIFDAGSWTPVGQPLSGHSLTITSIRFSPDDRMILTVSRDRSWHLFAADDEANEGKLSTPGRVKISV